MKCAYCGYEFPDDMSFCPECGLPVQAAPAEAPAPADLSDGFAPIEAPAPAGEEDDMFADWMPREDEPAGETETPDEAPPAPKPKKERKKLSPETVAKLTDGFPGILKTHWAVLRAPGTETAPGEATGFLWAPVVLLELIFFALAATIDLRAVLNAGEGFPFAKLFGVNLLAAFLFLALTLGLALADLKLIRKRPVHFNTVLNHLTVPALPLLAVLLFNMLSGVISPFFPCFFFLLAFLFTQIARADMMKKLCGTVQLPYFELLAIYAAALLFTLMIGFALYKGIIEDLGNMILQSVLSMAGLAE